MCLGNFEPVVLPTFDLSLPNENTKGACDYVKHDQLDSLSLHISDLRILHFNIRGLISKQHQLFNLLINGFGTAKPIDISLLNETCLRKENINKANLPGYTFLSKEWIGQKGGGITVIIANKYKCREWSDLEISDSKLEYLVVEIKTKCSSFLIASAYRPPNVDAKQFIQEYQKLTGIISTNTQNKIPVITGIDHNMAFLKSNVHQLTQDFIEMNIDSGLLPVISRPTRITRSSATLIDNIFVSQQLMNDYWCGLLIDDLSKNLPCLLSIENLNPDTNGFNTILSRKLTDTKMTNIKHDLASIDWSQLLLTNSCQANYDLFETTLTNILDKHAPILVKTQRERCKPEPWITKGICKCRLWLKKLYKEFLTCCSDTNKIK